VTKSALILIGAGGHTASCIDVIEQQGFFQIGGLVASPEELAFRKVVCGYSVIGVDCDLHKLVNSYEYALISIGQLQSAKRRISMFHQIRECGYQLPVIVSPTAYVSTHAAIGQGTIIMHGAIVNAGARIGDNCIINSRALIEHDATVEDHCHIATGAIINGEVVIGAGSFIGSGSTIKQRVVIGRDCQVGMGVGVRHNIDDCSVYTGVEKA
jgi:sugar O-acyltransferase (sialic acid O-acetyltransferase NeuD family)